MTMTEKDSLTACWGRIMKHEIQRIRNISELGIILQLQQATWDNICRDGYGISDMSTLYEGENAARAMPEISQIYEDETFEQKVIFLGNGTISNPTMFYREIGTTGPFSTSDLISVGSSTHVLKTSLHNPGYDFEYFIQGSVGGETVTYPVTGGEGTVNINKTVITVKNAGF
jgi:hypothetical protein